MLFPQRKTSEIHEFRLLIKGELAFGAASLDVINPATGKVLTTCARADGAQLDAVVAGWSMTAIDDRRRRLNLIAGILESKTAEFARLLTEEQGKPLAQATGDPSP